MSNTVVGPLLPLPGPLATTPSGLPYPTAQGLLADTDVYIRDLAQAIDYRLNNRSLLMSQQWLTTNANGDMTITFAGFTAVQGVVIQPALNQPNGSADIWVLVPMLTGLIGNSATVHVWYMNTKQNGYNVSNFGGAGMQYSIFAWGVPR